MTEESLEKYLTVLAKQQGVSSEDIPDHVKNVINIGLGMFWGARPWGFKTKSSTLDTSGSWPYNLPGDFSAMRTVSERDSVTGMSLLYYTKIDFDRAYPDLDLLATGTPQVACIYYDDRWKIKFFPRPSVDTVYIDYYTAGTPQVSDVPGDYITGLIACIEPFLYRPGPLRLAAMNAAEKEMGRLESANVPVIGMGTKMLDDTDVAVNRSYPWARED